MRKLVVVSAPCRRDAWFPEILAAFDQMSSATLFDQLRQSPMYKEWVKVAPDPDAFPETDLGLLRAADTTSPRELLRLADNWRPFRAYAAIYLWAAS